MPASPFSVWINILGSVNPSVARSLTQVNRQLVGLQRQVVATNRVMQMGFGRLLGLGAGLAGIGSIVAGMKQAVDLASQNEQIQEATLVILRNQREIRHQNSQLAVSDLRALNEQAISLQQQTGLYKNVFERGSLILAQSHRTAGEIKSLQYSMANVLAAQRMQGKSAESMAETYAAVGKSIETGMARNLNSVGIILTPMEKRLLMMNAYVGNFAGNIKIIEAAMNRTFAGIAKLRMQTLTGRTELALANMRLSLERMGDALRPIGQRLTNIFARLVSLIEPVVTRLANLISEALRSHMKDIAAWMDYIRKYGIPLMVEWINKGWLAIIKAIQWFQKNSNWLVPLIKYTAIVVGLFTVFASVITAVAAGIVFLITPLGWVTVGLTAVSVAILAIIDNWRQLKQMIGGFGEWLLGTKQMDPHNKGLGSGVMRGFRKGVVPRAQPVQKGALWEWVDQLSKVLDEWTRIITKWWGKMSKWVSTEITGMIGTITTALQNIWHGIDQFLIHPLTTVSDLWKRFLDTIGISGGPVNPGFESGGGAGGSRGTTGNWTGGGGGGTVWTPPTGIPLRRQAPFPGAVRAMSEWVPGEPKTHATQYGATGAHLQLGDVAVSVDLMKQMGVRLGGYIDILDKQGKVILAHQHVMDTSWFAKGRPTHGIELWGRPDIGWAQVRPSVSPRELAIKKATVPATTRGLGEASATPVHINYNVTNHIHGGEDLEHRMAAVHRRHLDQMQRDLAEVTYRQNRSAFDGAQAV